MIVAATIILIIVTIALAISDVLAERDKRRRSRAMHRRLRWYIT